MTDYQTLLDDLHARYQSLDEGHIATYIPQLAKANPDWFGIALVTADGECYHTGDSEHLFTMQSVSKPFTYGMALSDHGRDYVLTRIGVEPSGQRFNSVVLDERTGRPYNPMVNAGAIAIADIITGETITHKLNRLLDTFHAYAGRKLHLDAATFTSEQQTGHRNRAIAHLMRGSDMLQGNLDDALHLYFQQCSLLISALDLAQMAATLANGGLNPLTDQRAIDKSYTRDILSVMYTCGMYDSSGEWAYRVGVPAKSGVSGGIMMVSPGRMGIAVFSPLLNEYGHSIRGLRVCQELSDALELHVFNSA